MLPKCIHRFSALLLLLVIVSCNNLSLNKHFDPDKWKSDKTSRKELANDIIESKILIGKSYQDVHSILGNEDFGSKISDTTPDNPNFTIQYILDNCDLIDFERLVIYFESGEVTQNQKECR